MVLPKITIKKEYIGALALILFLASDMVNTVVDKFTPMDSSNAWIITSFMIYTLAILYILIQNKKIKIDFLFLFTFVLIFMFITYLVRPDYGYWLFEYRFSALQTVFKPITGIFGLFIIQLIDDKKLVFNSLKVASWSLLIYYLYLYLRYLGMGYWQTIGNAGQPLQADYSLAFGYILYFLALVFMVELFQNKKKIYIIPSFICLFLIITAGSRGAIVALVMFFVAYALFYAKNLLSKKSLITIGIIVGVIIILIFTLDYIAQFLISVLDSLGISSRSLSLLLKNGFTNNNGRFDIFEKSFGLVLESPILGQGFYGERSTIGPFFIWGYSHNFFLEVLVDFGLVLGIPLALFSVWYPIKIIYTCKDKTWKMLLLIFYATTFKLMLSFSFWQDPYFWMFVGLLLDYRRHHKEDSAILPKRVYDYFKKRPNSKTP